MSEFSKILELSTAHIKPDTEKRLEAGNFDGIPSYRKPNPNKVDESFGSWVACGYISIDSEDIVDIPEDLMTILEYAAKNDVRWIMFDCDAAVNEELPTYYSYWEHDAAKHEVVGEIQLLRTYMSHMYPNGLFAVQEFVDRDIGLNGQLLSAYAEAGFKIAPVPGWTIVEIDEAFESKLMQDFNKSGIDIWIFRDGELINETR